MYGTDIGFEYGLILIGLTSRPCKPFVHKLICDGNRNEAGDQYRRILLNLSLSS